MSPKTSVVLLFFIHRPRSAVRSFLPSLRQIGLETDMGLVRCPRDCGGPSQGTCDHGRCICEDTWEPPLCVTNATDAIPSDDPFAPPSNTSRCWRPLAPLPLTICADTHEYDCNATVDLSINGDTVAHFAVDLPRSEDLLQSQCQQLFRIDGYVM